MLFSIMAFLLEFVSVSDTLLLYQDKLGVLPVLGAVLFAAGKAAGHGAAVHGPGGPAEDRVVAGDGQELRSKQQTLQRRALGACQLPAGAVQANLGGDQVPDRLAGHRPTRAGAVHVVALPFKAVDLDKPGDLRAVDFQACHGLTSSVVDQNASVSAVAAPAAVAARAAGSNGVLCGVV